MKNPISQREFEVLELIAFEYTDPQIAQKLFISKHTVKTHRKNLMVKLHAKKSAGLIRIAYETGIMQIRKSA